jgi:preprotein translocase SecE subunit
MIEKIKIYIKESINELKKVKWLTWRETYELTFNIFIFTLIFLVLYGIIDFILVRFILLF